MADVAVLAERLERTYGDTNAVAGIDLQVSAGEVYGFLGPNGAGKSTTVRMLCTLLRPTGGRAVVAGYDVAHQPDEVRLHIGAALQDAALDDKQTGRELLRLRAGEEDDRLRQLSLRLQVKRLAIDQGEERFPVDDVGLAVRHSQADADDSPMGFDNAAENARRGEEGRRIGGDEGVVETFES